jgi:hypothetical protein
MEKTTSDETNETEPENEIAPISAPEPVSAPELDPQLEIVPEELLELDDDEDDEEEAGSGLVSGGFGLAALGLAFVSITGSWFGTSFTAYKSIKTQLQYTSTQETGAQQLASVVDGWRDTAVFGGIFALAALLSGAGVLAAPNLLLSGKTPGWARGAALAGVILGLVGLLLALLTYFHVIPGNLTYPPTAPSTSTGGN